MAQNTIGVKLHVYSESNSTLSAIMAGSQSLSGAITYGNMGVGESMGVTFLGLQEVGELGFHQATASNGFDKIEVTTLADTKHEYINGLVADTNDSANNELSFKFLYDPAQFELFKKLQTDYASGYTFHTFYVSLPDNSAFQIAANISDVKLDSLSVGSAITVTLNMSVLQIDFLQTIPTVLTASTYH